MTFVLEALKKQEAGADPDAAVSLARETAHRRRHRIWVGLFAAAMAGNAVILFWVFGLPLLRPAEAPAVPVAAAPAPRQPEGAAAPAEPSRRGAVLPGTADAGGDGTEDVPRAAPAPRTRPAPQPVAVSLQDLPADARARFPGLAFSTHIYAEDVDLRAIVANGERLQEGDRIRGLEILEITETGVVLRFERYRVTVPIVTDW